MIKVVHICSSDIIGGAAKAAYRLHRSFSGHPAVESRMLVRGKASDDSKVIRYVPRLLSLNYYFNLSIKRRITDVFWSRFQTSNKVMHSRADIRTGLLSCLRTLPCDLVHMHWLGRNTLSVEEIGQISKPVVWTLHDMWTFCGAEHYVDDATDSRFHLGYKIDNRSDGESGPDMNRNVWNRKRKSWKRPMTIVCPSRWMADCAKDSVILKNWPLHCVPNPLDLDSWKPFPKEHARKLLGLPQDKHIVLFGAIGGERDPRKGADLLRLALEKLRNFGADVHLVVFGQSEPVSRLPHVFPVTYLGRLQDEFSMIAAYNSADLMLIPSLQDNLPQTAVEAHACGIPVIAFNVGGLSDVVNHKITGYLARPYDTEDFAQGIALLLNDNEKIEQMAQAARQVALKKFAAPVVANAYADIYRKVLVGYDL